MPSSSREPPEPLPDPASAAEVFGARVKARRLQLGWSITDLCEAWDNKDRSYVYRVERGEYDLRQSVMSEIAFVLGVNLGTLTDCLLPQLDRQDELRVPDDFVPRAARRRARRKRTS